MNDATKGSLEGMLDNLVTEFARVSNVRFIEQELPVLSIRDLALGNAIGEALARSHFLILVGENHAPTKEDVRDVFAMLKRRLPEIITKIERELGR